VKSQGWAVYGDFTWALSDRVDLTAGARYTYDKKTMSDQVLDSGGALGNNFNYEFFTNGAVKDSASWSDFTPRIAISFQANDDVNLYATASRGYKSGGYGSFAISPDQPFGTTDVTGAEANPASFDPETVWSYELGAKGDLLDGTMRVGFNVYFYDYKDLQVTVPGTASVILPVRS